MNPKLILFICVAVLFIACTKPVQVAKNDDPLHDIKQTVRNKFPSVQQLSTSELDGWLKDANREKPLLLDARKSEEFSVSHLQGAVNAGEESQIADALKNYPKEKPIVAYCSVGWRSSMLTEKLKAQGYSNVVNLEGSIFQWANEGRPVYQNSNPVTQVHQFDKKWGELLKPELRYPVK